jgi:hypothetical protein
MKSIFTRLALFLACVVCFFYARDVRGQELDIMPPTIWANDALDMSGLLLSMPPQPNPYKWIQIGGSVPPAQYPIVEFLEFQETADAFPWQSTNWVPVIAVTVNSTNPQPISFWAPCLAMPTYFRDVTKSQP